MWQVASPDKYRAILLTKPRVAYKGDTLLQISKGRLKKGGYMKCECKKTTLKVGYKGNMRYIEKTCAKCKKTTREYKW